MDCVIHADNIMQFTTMQEISTMHRCLHEVNFFRFQLCNYLFVQVVDWWIFAYRYLSEQYPNPKIKFLCSNYTASMVNWEEKMTYCVAQFREIISQTSNSYILVPLNVGKVFSLIYFNKCYNKS